MWEQIDQIRLRVLKNDLLALTIRKDCVCPKNVKAF